MSLVRHESRLIRPFLLAEEVRDVLVSASIRIKFGDHFSSQEVQILRPEDVALASPALLPAVDVKLTRELIKKLGIKVEDVKVVVIATSDEMRLSEVICSHPIDDIPADEISLLPTLSKFLTAKGGCEVTIALVLVNQLPAKALRPTSIGNWLARKTFHLRPEKPTEGFRILPLTESDRLRLRLPAGVFYYVEKAGTLNDKEAKIQDILTIWVSEPIFNALSRDQSSRASAAFQKLMLCEVTATIVLGEVAELENAMPESGSPLDAFFGELAKNSKQKKEQLVQYATRSGDHGRLRAHIQEMLDVSGALKSAL